MGGTTTYLGDMIFVAVEINYEPASLYNVNGRYEVPLLMRFKIEISAWR